MLLMRIVRWGRKWHDIFRPSHCAEGALLATLRTVPGMTGRTRRTGILLQVGVPVALLLGVVWFRLLPVGSFPYPPCPVHALTGWWCPGCGSTRAVNALAQGEVLLAWGYNPLLLVFLALGAGWWLGRSGLIPQKAHQVLQRGNEAWRHLTHGYGTTMGLLVVVVTYGLARNLTTWTWLQP